MKLVINLAFALLATSVYANEAHRLLSQLPTEKQRIALAHIVRSAGEKCPTVSKVFYQGQDRQQTAIWHAQCDTGRAYAISLRNDAQGSTKVLDCTTLKVVAKVECFK